MDIIDISDHSGIWFTYAQKKYAPKKYLWKWIAKILPKQRFFEWSEKPEPWDYRNCKISVMGMEDDRARLAIRRKKILKRSSHELGNEVVLMMGFIITDVQKPQLGNYHEPLGNSENKVYGKERKRWFLTLTNVMEGKPETQISDCTIWKWADEPSADKHIEEIYETILKKKGQAESDKGIFKVDAAPSKETVPVIYQPRIDAWKNYVHAIHLDEKADKIECHIVFNGEQLRVSWIFEDIYKRFRRWRFGRVKDLESFQINLNDGIPESMTFEGIYSGDHPIDDDYVHHDKKWPWSNPPKRQIKYFFSNKKHPIIFINTSNHAMAEHDNNHEFWKWEYTAWARNSPVILGHMTKNEIEEMLRNKEAAK